MKVVNALHSLVLITAAAQKLYAPIIVLYFFPYTLKNLIVANFMEILSEISDTILRLYLPTLFQVLKYKERDLKIILFNVGYLPRSTDTEWPFLSNLPRGPGRQGG